ncbi:MAG: hypothetical protein IMF11_15805 [Proteobacteria bacterium]|nr:hypothetical protein [Pseudomonadota bacterium]
MSKGKSTGVSGIFSWFSILKYDKRRIVIAEGTDFHELERETTSVFGFLKHRLGAEFHVDSTGRKAEYKNHEQKVHYFLEVVHKKSEFKEALKTDGIIVVYAGHSRYGRGACFDEYTKTCAVEGDQWENGNNDNGLFRLGYRYVPVPIHDIRKHKYKFAPVPVTTAKGHGRPRKMKWHPYNFEKDYRWRRLRIFTLPKDLQKYVIPKYKADSAKYPDKYYGLLKREEGKLVRYLILHAGWEGTQCPDYELKSTTMRCRTFCHFGCSSKQHFWDIIRHPKYKEWKRPKPPTDRLAYFTNAPGIVWHLWVYFLLMFSEENDPSNSGRHWWRSHQYGKRKTNDLFRAEKRRLRVY